MTHEHIDLKGQSVPETFLSKSNHVEEMRK